MRNWVCVCVGQMSSRLYLTHPCGMSMWVGLKLSAGHVILSGQRERINAMERGGKLEEAFPLPLQSPSATS